MDMHQWIMRSKGLQVSDISYFLYVHCGGMINLTDSAKALMHFCTSLPPYTGSDCWIEGALVAINQILLSDTMPNHSEECEFRVLLTL
jgi:hypothetical protein